MAIYDFKCKKCNRIKTDVALPITHLKGDLPSCCNQIMAYYITSPPGVHWKDPNIEPFRAIATKDRPVITTTRQNREYMARNGLIDANELGPPPTPKQTQETVAKMQESIDAITPTGEVKEDMKKRGLLDIVE